MLWSELTRSAPSHAVGVFPHFFYLLCGPVPLLFRYWQSMVDGITMGDGIMPNLTATLQLLVPLYLLQLSTGPAASHCSLTGDVRRSSKSFQCLPDDVMHSLLVHTISLLQFFFFFSFISLIDDGPHHYHPACGHKGSSHLSPVHALQFFIAMRVQHSYNSSTNNG